ncbi:hypothetical protein NOVO_03985 [Rickettsiales bacterium Ac37b]|nr:hypothetical protein NOVO_03985 [Rickettsiales bacterium Ac37b]
MKIKNNTQVSRHSPYIRDYTKMGEKSGGATDSGTHGGIYQLEHNGTKTTILFKQGREDGEIISEYVASQLYKLTTNKAADCFLAKWDQNTDTTEKNTNGFSSNVYIGSVFFNNFTDLFKEAGFSERPKFTKLLHSDKVSEIINKVQATKEHNYGLEDILAATLWHENRDIHWGNLGVTRNKHGKIDSTVTLDFGWAFHNIADEISLFGHTKYLIPGKPTNHFWDYSVDNRKLYISNYFTDALDKVAAVPTKEIKQNIKQSLNEVGKFYDNQGIESFARRIGMSLKKEENISLDKIGDYLSTKMINRQVSIKNLSTQIKLDLAISKDEKGQYKFDQERIKQLVLDNPSFFTGQNNLKFRKLEHKADTKFLNSAIQSIISSKEGTIADKQINNKLSEFINKLIEYIKEIFSNPKLIAIFKKNDNKVNI